MGLQRVCVRDLTKDLGSELRGLDIADPLDEATAAALRRMLHTRGVLVVRGSHLTPAQSLAFYCHFLSREDLATVSTQGGAVVTNNRSTVVASTGELFQVVGNRSGVQETGSVAQREPGLWHGDLGTYRTSWDYAACNPTLLHALVVPERGDGKLSWGGSELSFAAGATLFVRGSTLLAALPGELARRCHRVRVRYRTNMLGAHSGHVQASQNGLCSLPEATAPPEGWVLGDPQPIIWRHPETQLESLQVSAFTCGIFEELIGLGCGADAASVSPLSQDGAQNMAQWARMSRVQSAAFLEEIMSHGLTPQNTLCVNYDVGTTVIWDNRLVLHRSTPPDGNPTEEQERLMHRVFVTDQFDHLSKFDRVQKEAKL